MEKWVVSDFEMNCGKYQMGVQILTEIFVSLLQLTWECKKWFYTIDLF